MKRLFTLLVILLNALFSNAQQLNSTSFYDLYPILHNPASAGSEPYASVGASFKKQWSSMPGSPQTALVFAQVPFSKANIGVGGYLYHDVTGPTSCTGVQLAYAHHIKVKDDSRFSVGLEGRMLQMALDRAKVQEDLGNDPASNNFQKQIKGDAGLGFAYTAPGFQVGAAVSQLLQTKLKNGQMYGSGTDQARLWRHYYLHGFYKWKTDEENIIIPNLLIIYLPNAPMELQGGARIEHKDLFWFGFTWRMRQAWMLSAGVKLPQNLSVGYSFDIYTTPLSVFDKGSNGHELFLRYTFSR